MVGFIYTELGKRKSSREVVYPLCTNHPPPFVDKSPNLLLEGNYKAVPRIEHDNIPCSSIFPSADLVGSEMKKIHSYSCYRRIFKVYDRNLWSYL